jgi:putative peptidoglycan lipid II flippase
MDAFFVAFKIPNFLRRLSAEGAFSQAFVPVVSEYKVKRSQPEVRELVSGVAGTFGVILLLVTLLGVIGAPVLIFLFGFGFLGDARFDMAVGMLHWTFPYLFFISLVSLCSGVLNSYGRFGAPAFTPVLLNAVLILFSLFVAPRTGNPGLWLAIGVFVAGFVQLLFLWPFMARLGVVGLPGWHWSHEGVRRIARLMLPGIFGSSVAQVSLLLDSVVASLLAAGSVSWLYYADRLVEFPMGVLSVALATVILPGLSGHHAAQAPDRFAATLDSAVRTIVLLVTPAAVGLFVLAGPLVATIYGYGEFDNEDIHMTRYALMAYSLGLMGFSLVKVLAPGYFARQDARTPVRIGIVAFSVNMAFNLLVVLPAALIFHVPLPHALLALSTGLSAILNATLLFLGLKKAGVYRAAPRWGGYAARILLAAVVMAGAVWWIAGDLQRWLSMRALERASWLAICIAAGVAIYFGLLLIMGLRWAQFRRGNAG